MDLRPVKSSAIAAIGYDAATNTMRVRFHSGREYDYPGITAQAHADFLDAPSPGRHFHRHFLGREHSKAK